MQREQTEFEKAIESEVFVDRLLVILECSTCTSAKSHFHQVLLDQGQFKRISDAIVIESQGTDPDNSNLENCVVRVDKQRSIKQEPFEGMSDIFHELS